MKGVAHQYYAYRQVLICGYTVLHMSRSIGDNLNEYVVCDQCGVTMYLWAVLIEELLGEEDIWMVSPDKDLCDDCCLLLV